MYKFPSLLGGFSDKNEMIWRPQTPVNRSIIINGEHVRRFFPRTWLWEEVQMGFVLDFKLFKVTVYATPRCNISFLNRVTKK